MVDLDLGALATGSGAVSRMTLARGAGSGTTGTGAAAAAGPGGHGHGQGQGVAPPEISHDISTWLRLPLLVETQRQMLQAVGSGGLQPHKLVASWRLLFRRPAAPHPCTASTLVPLDNP